MGPRNSKIPFPVPKVWGQGEDGERVSRIFGEISETERTKLLGIFGGKFPKIPHVSGGDKGNEFGDNQEIPVFSPKLDKCHFIFYDL